jgi:hypothetical protein
VTGGKDTGLVDDGMEEKEEGVHGRGRREVGSITLATLIVGETKIELRSRWRFDALNTGVLRDIFVLHQTLLFGSALRMSTHSSTKRCMMGSCKVNGVDLNFFEENISVNDCRAACVYPTEMRPSACSARSLVWKTAPYWTAKRVKGSI